jgi:hypothetical protein
MGTLKQVAKKIPFILPVYRTLCNGYTRYQLRSKNVEEIFTGIYENNAWGGKDSVSGTGSDVHQTKIIAKELPNLFDKYNISTILDIPCGDFHWMNKVDLNSVDYIGADIVKELIQKNSEMFAGEHIRFQRLNLIEDNLPKVDLVFCRDCLVHLSFADISLALDNIRKSESEYLLTTTFTGRKDNGDITTGQWRILNLQMPPFDLPKPQKVILEGCSEEGDTYKDKALGLWKIADIKESLTRHCEL